jgi:hypothetical protein
MASVPPPAEGSRRGRAIGALDTRIKLALAGSSLVLLIAVVLALDSGSHPGPPLPGIGRPAPAGDPFAYRSDRRASFEARATAGSAHVLFAKSPGGVLATAARVASFRPQIDSATAGTGVDPAILEAIVFLESAGRPSALAGADPSAAAGLTQILAETGQSLLGMHVDLARSRKLTQAIDRAAALGQAGLVGHYQRERAKIDDRFDPRKALAATVRYLQIARQRFGLDDLAVVSYHMGIGNLGNVLTAYDGGAPVPYAQLYFDTAPDRHADAFKLMQGFGDDSSLYYWRVLGARDIMALYRSNRAALARLAGLQTARNSSEEVLHPPDRTPSFSDPDALRAAYAKRAIVPLPANATALNLAYDPGIGALAPQLGAPASLYRGLQPNALDLLVELAARVRALSGATGALTVTSTVRDNQYQRLLGSSDVEATHGYSLHTTGYALDIARRYASAAQAAAFQAVLDRLQALNLIAWVREPAAIHVVVAGDASRVIVGGP